MIVINGHKLNVIHIHLSDIVQDLNGNKGSGI